MKLLKLKSFIILGVFCTFLGCSNRQFSSTKIIIASNLSSNSNSVLSGTSSDGDFFTLIVNSSDKYINLDIPSGTWTFYGIHIDGDYTSRCAYSSSEILGPSQEVNIVYSLENCANEIFGNGQNVDKKNGFNQLKIYSCNDLSSINFGDSDCGLNNGGSPGSFKIIIPEVELSNTVNPIIGDEQISLECHSFGNEHYTLSNYRVPLGNPTTLPFHFDIESFKSDDCSGESQIYSSNYSLYDLESSGVVKSWTTSTVGATYNTVFFQNEKSQIGQACISDNHCQSGNCQNSTCQEESIDCLSTEVANSNYAQAESLSGSHNDPVINVVCDNGYSGGGEWSCDQMGSWEGEACSADGICGNGIVETLEVCDDGNTITELACDYGDATCSKCHNDCSMTQELMGSYCGDGIPDLGDGEECDDGQETASCSATCTKITSFISTWRTTGLNETITIPTTGTGYDYTIDWGDENSTVDDGASTDENPSHTYSVAGDYTITITGTFSRIYFNGAGDKTKLISISNLGDVGWTSFEGAFFGCSNLGVINGGNLSNVTTTYRMFRDTPLADPDTSDWDVSNVTDMRQMFRSAATANPDVSNWDVSSVERMDDMFIATTLANPNVSSWNTVNVTNMAGMFKSAQATTLTEGTGTRNWNVSNVTNMQHMFDDTEVATPDVSLWDTSSVTTMFAMFHKSKAANPDVSTNGNIWDVSNVTNMQHMFQESEAATLTVGTGTTNWNTSKVTTMQEMFRNAGPANPDVSGWDTSNVTKMAHMFDNADYATPNTTNWDTSSVVHMGVMFYNTALANPDVSNWDTAKVTNMSGMFQNALSANPVTTTDGNIWNTHKVTNFASMFKNAVSANPDVSGWDTAKASSFGNMFYGAESANPDTSNWNMVKGTSMQDIFKDSGISDANYSTFLNRVYATSNQTNVNMGTVGDSSSPAKYYPNAVEAHGIITGADPSELVWTITDGGESSDFVSVWRTTTENESITIPTTGAAYSYTINWGDPNDTSDDVTIATSDANPSHNYSEPGDYTVTISGTFPRIYFNWGGNKDNLISVPNLGSVGWTSFQIAFAGCSNLVEFSGGDTSDVTNMENMFQSSGSVTPDTSGWNTSNVTTMHGLFAGATSANPDTSGWDTSSVTGMGSMFYNAVNATPDTSGWDTSNLTNVNQMFYGATSATPTTTTNNNIWNTSKVTNMEAMFYQATSANPDTSSWDTSNVTNMSQMFYQAISATPITETINNIWNTSKVTNMEAMFYQATSANPDTSGWDIGNVTNISNFLYDSAISDENYSKFLVMAAAKSSESSISIGTVSAGYYDSATDAKTTLEFLGWSITDNDSVGAGACGDDILDTTLGEACDEGGDTALCSDTCLLKTEFVSTWLLSENDKTITLPLAETDNDGTAFVYDFTVNWGDGTSTVVTSFADHPVTHTYTFTEAEKEYTLKISGTMETIRFANSTEKDKIISIPNLGDVGWTSFYVAFEGCANLGTVSGGDTSNVTSMYSMFYGATVADPDTSSWDTSNVTNMSFMFRGATSADPDTSTWDTSNVTNMSYMFKAASAANPNTAEWDTSEVTLMTSMFEEALNAEPDTSKWDTSKVTNMNSMFWAATSANPDTSTWDVGEVTNMKFIFGSSGILDANYSKFLVMAETTSQQNDIQLSVVPASYSEGVAATARGDLTKAITSGGHKWSIFDNGPKGAPPTLVNPTSSSSPWTTPIFQVSGLSVDDVVTLYTDHTCSTAVGSAISLGDAVDIQTDELETGSYTFYSKTDSGFCSSGSDTYTVVDPVEVYTSNYGANTCVVKPSGGLVCWGYGAGGVNGQGHANILGDGDGCLEDGSITDQTTCEDDGHTWGLERADQIPEIDLGTNRTVEKFSLSSSGHACAILDDDSLKCWGNNGNYNLGRYYKYDAAGSGDELNAVFGDDPGEMGDSLYANSEFGGECSNTSYDTQAGCEGVGADWSEYVPTDVKTAQVNTCVLLDNPDIEGHSGVVKCWGNGEYVVGHDLGISKANSIGGSDGVNAAPNAIKDFPGMHFNGSNPDNIAATNIYGRGRFNFCATLADGGMKCWGWPGAHLLAQGDSTSQLGTSSSPMTNANNIDLGNSCSDTRYIDEASCTDAGETWDVPATAAHVSLGTKGHACALLNDGRIKCWGSNGSGLGLNYDVQHASAGQLIGDGDSCYTDFSYTDETTCLAAGESWGPEMGDNLSSVDLGYGCSNPTYNDNQTNCETNNHTWSKNISTYVSVGYGHACALIKNGTIKCWGDGNYGQMGLDLNVGHHHYNEGNLDTLPVVNLGTGRTAVALETGKEYTCAVLDDNTVVCWGRAKNGAKGLGDNQHYGKADFGRSVSDIVPLDFSE